MGIEHIQDLIKGINITPELKIGLQKAFQNGFMSFNVGVVPQEIPPHLHKISDELYYVHKGHGRMKIDDTEAAVSDGDLVIIPKGSVHGLVNTGRGDMIIFVITAPPFDPINDRFPA